VQIAFVLDIIIAVLLVLTITYAVRLNQRLGQLRSDKNELQKLAKTFAEATTKAEASIQQLKISSDMLQDDLKTAEALRDDLAYLIDRGGRTADQMVDTVRSPGHAADDKDDFEEGESRLIAEAIRAASPAGAGRSPSARPAKGGGGKKNTSGERKGGGLLGRLRGAVRDDEQSVSAPVPSRSVENSSRKSTPDPSMGGGLGGLNPQDRLIEERSQGGEVQTVGDTDAARELLKALSSVK